MPILNTYETSEFRPDPHYRLSPRSCRKDALLDRVPEEKETFMADKELERRGLYPGPYCGLLALYSLTPLTTLAIFLVLGSLPSFAYPQESEQWKEQYPAYLPFPLPELLISVAFSSLSHLLRKPIFSLASLSIFEHAQYVSIILSCVLHTVSALMLRVYSFAILMFTVNVNSALSNSAISTKIPGFRIVWWTALGWAIAEATIGITQGYQAIGLYKDVLVSNQSCDLSLCKNDGPSFSSEGNKIGKGKQAALPCDHVALSHREPASYGTLSSNDLGYQASSSTNAPTLGERRPLLRVGSDLSVITSSSFASLHPSVAWDKSAEEGDIETEESELQVQVDRDIDHLLAFRKREELEMLYGIPFVKVPVFISCLHRVNALLQSLGFSLLLSAAYTHTFSTRRKLAAVQPQPFLPTRTLITSVFFIHLFLTLLHTSILLPKLGVHTVVYISFITALGAFFVGLAVWGGVS